MSYEYETDPVDEQASRRNRSKEVILAIMYCLRNHQAVSKAEITRVIRRSIGKAPFLGAFSVNFAGKSPMLDELLDLARGLAYEPISGSDDLISVRPYFVDHIGPKYYANFSKAQQEILEKLASAVRVSDGALV